MTSHFPQTQAGQDGGICPDRPLPAENRRMSGSLNCSHFPNLRGFVPRLFPIPHSGAGHSPLLPDRQTGLLCVLRPDPVCHLATPVTGPRSGCGRCGGERGLSASLVCARLATLSQLLDQSVQNRSERLPCHLESSVRDDTNSHTCRSQKVGKSHQKGRW